MRHLVLSIGVASLAAGCIKAPSLQPVAQVGTGLLGAGLGLQSAGASIDSAASNLRRGLEGLDPAGIKQLLATNAQLRDELDAVQRIYLQGMGEGVVDITGRNVKVRVTRTVGDLIVNAWIDRPENLFWSGRVTNRDERLPLDIESFLREYPLRRCRGLSGAAASACIGAAQSVAPVAAEVLVQETFQRWLRSQPAAPAPDLPPSIANPRFGGSGEHRINFQVVPVQADANGNWAARLEIWLVDAQGNESNVFVYDVDNRRFPGHQMEDPLPTIAATLTIKAGPTPVAATAQAPSQ